MKKFSRALSFVMTLAMMLSGIAAAEQQYFNNGGGGEVVDPHTFTKPYAVNEVIVPADEATGQVALEAHVKNVIEVDGLKFKDLNGNGTLDVYEDWRQPVDARVDDLLSQMTLDEEIGLLWHASTGVRSPACIPTRRNGSIPTNLHIPPRMAAATFRCITPSSVIT